MGDYRVETNLDTYISDIFFIKDILKQEDIELKHCPTERMIADYFTKPLQGKQFRKLQDIIMGLSHFPDKERVEINKISVTRKISNPTMTKRTYADTVRTMDVHDKVSKKVRWKRSESTG